LLGAGITAAQLLDTIGVVLHPIAVTVGLMTFAATASISAFLHAMLDYRVGCQIRHAFRAGRTGREKGRYPRVFWWYGSD
jgi:hypothetical protein